MYNSLENVHKFLTYIPEAREVFDIIVLLLLLLLLLCLYWLRYVNKTTIIIIILQASRYLQYLIPRYFKLEYAICWQWFEWSICTGLEVWLRDRSYGVWSGVRYYKISCVTDNSSSRTWPMDTQNVWHSRIAHSIVAEWQWRRVYTTGT